MSTAWHELPADLQRCLDAGTDLLIQVCRARATSPPETPLVNAMLYPAEVWIEAGNDLPRRFADAADEIQPVLPELEFATDGLVTVGKYSQPTAYGVVLDLAWETVGALMLARMPLKDIEEVGFRAARNMQSTDSDGRDAREALRRVDLGLTVGTGRGIRSHGTCRDSRSSASASLWPG